MVVHSGDRTNLTPTPQAVREASQQQSSRQGVGLQFMGV